MLFILYKISESIQSAYMLYNAYYACDKVVKKIESNKDNLMVVKSSISYLSYIVGYSQIKEFFFGIKQ